MSDLSNFLEHELRKAQYVEKVPDPKTESGFRYIYEEDSKKKNKQDDQEEGSSSQSFKQRTYKLSNGENLKVYSKEGDKYTVSLGDNAKEELTIKEIAEKYT